MSALTDRLLADGYLDGGNHCVQDVFDLCEEVKRLEKVAEWVTRTEPIASATINAIGRRAHETAKSKGFYDNPPSIPERLALIHSEVSEALEAYRDNELTLTISETGKPEGLPSELADAVIRIADMCDWLGIDLDHAIEVKMAFNATRPFRHGRKVL